ncbi:creatininase family protein [Candidatus Latescibacterota bacterium]
MSKNTRRNFLRSMAVSGMAAGVVSSKNAIAQSDAPLSPSYLSPQADKYIDPRKVLLYECTRKELRERINSGQLKAAIIPTGSTEQHNEHMAMIMDAAGALLVSQHAALKLYPQVIVTTPVAFGVSPYWMARQGTITLREEIFTGIVYDICCCIKTHGIDTILIVNGHGGNREPLKKAVPDYRLKLGINIEWCQYTEAVAEEQQAAMEGKESFLDSTVEGEHAGEIETSICLAAFPERVHRVTYEGIEPYKWNTDKADLDRVRYYTHDVDKTPDWDKDSFEDSKLATEEKGELIIGKATNWIADKLLKMMG